MAPKKAKLEEMNALLAAANNTLATKQASYIVPLTLCLFHPIHKTINMGLGSTSIGRGSTESID